MCDRPSEESLSTYQDVQLVPDSITINDDSSESLDSKSNVVGCDLCGIKVTSVNVLRRHLEGRRHIMRAERQGKTFDCELCQISANSQSQLDAHLKSARHRNRLFRKEHAHEFSTKGIWIILFCMACLFLNLLLLFKRLL